MSTTASTTTQTTTLVTSSAPPPSSTGATSTTTVTTNTTTTTTTTTTNPPNSPPTLTTLGVPLAVSGVVSGVADTLHTNFPGLPTLFPCQEVKILSDNAPIHETVNFLPNAPQKCLQIVYPNDAKGGTIIGNVRKDASGVYSIESSSSASSGGGSSGSKTAIILLSIFLVLALLGLLYMWNAKRKSSQGETPVKQQDEVEISNNQNVETPQTQV